jgi:beta-glucosidase
VPFPFGWGLSYAQFALTNVHAPPAIPCGGTAGVDVTVKNTSRRAGAEVVEVYARRRPQAPLDPLRSLVAFRRMQLDPGQTRTVRFELGPEAFVSVDDQGRRWVEPGSVVVAVGASQPDVPQPDGSSWEGSAVQIDLTGRAVQL